MDNFETQEIFNSIKDKLSNWASNVFNEFYGLQKLASLYYYTDMNALVNGIIVPEPEVNREICLWATKWSHLNDSQENYIALDMLKDVFKNNLEVYNAFVSLSGDNHSISFSKEKDYLPMEYVWCTGNRHYVRVRCFGIVESIWCQIDALCLL